MTDVRRKIRVLHIIKSLGRGGAETLLPETLMLHDKNKFEFYYIYFLPWKNQLVYEIEAAGGKVLCFAASNNLHIILQTRRIIRFIRENNIQLIHCHLPWAGIVGRLVHRLAGVPAIYTEHNKQERYHWITFILNKLTFNWQSKVIAVSNDVSQSIQKNIAPSVEVLTILNGVNTMAYVRDPGAGHMIRKAHGIPEDALVVGTIAVFRFQKRMEEWLEVARAVANQHKSVYFIIVGDGPLKDRIIQKRKSLHLEDRVILAGLQTDVKPWLSAMDVYMMTSLFEGLPVALLEAMSMECAVVSTNAGGIKEVIRADIDGLLVDLQDWPMLSRKLDGLIFNRSRARSLGSAARSRVVGNFSIEQMVAALEKLYRAIPVG